MKTDLLLRRLRDEAARTATEHDNMLAIKHASNPSAPLRVPTGPAIPPDWALTETTIVHALTSMPANAYQQDALMLCAVHPGIPTELLLDDIAGRDSRLNPTRTDTFMFASHALSNRHLNWGVLRDLFTWMTVTRPALYPIQPSPQYALTAAHAAAVDVLTNDCAPTDVTAAAVTWVLTSHARDQETGLSMAYTTYADALSHPSLTQNDFERLLHAACTEAVNRPQSAARTLLTHLTVSNGVTLGSRGEVPLGGRCTPALLDQARSALILAAACA